MKNEQRNGYLLRDRILSILSDEEVARVSMAETKARLVDGDEYIDLEHIDEGVRRTLPTRTQMDRLLPRSAVRQITWDKILHQLATPIYAAPDPNEPTLTSRNT